MGRGVFPVSELGELFRKESFARDTPHCLEHRRIAHSAGGNLIANHPNPFVC